MKQAKTTINYFKIWKLATLGSPYNWCNNTIRAQKSININLLIGYAVAILRTALVIYFYTRCNRPSCTLWCMLQNDIWIVLLLRWINKRNFGSFPYTRTKVARIIYVRIWICATSPASLRRRTAETIHRVSIHTLIVIHGSHRRTICLNYTVDMCAVRISIRFLNMTGERNKSVRSCWSAPVRNYI